MAVGYDIQQTAINKVSQASWLDPAADTVASVVQKLPRHGPIRDVLSGTPLGHPAHPALVALPIGSWASATYLDLFGGTGSRRAARRLVGLGNVVAVPTVLTGANDWADTTGETRRLGFVHASLNAIGLTCFAGSWWARLHGRQFRGATWSLVGCAAISAAGWVGGHLAYRLGVGVDMTAFEEFPQEWTDVASEAVLADGKPMHVEVAGASIMLLRRDGTLTALADRCPHRGAALHEGSVDSETVTCPLHQSRFRLRDGAVLAGPSTHPVPVLEVRTVDGRVQVRRAE